MKITGPRLLRIFLLLTLAAASPAAGQIGSTFALATTPPQDTMEIYFFDTPSPTLPKDQHLVLRLTKKGKTWTFNVKECPTRPPSEADGHAGTRETEETIGSKEKAIACSVDCNLSVASVRAAINQHSIRGILCLPQQDFLRERLDQIPLEQLRCFLKVAAHVKGTADDVAAEKDMSDLASELTSLVRDASPDWH